MPSRSVTLLFREVSRNPSHVRVSVFVGRNVQARGHAGVLTLRTDEWDETRNEISGTKATVSQGGIINFAADKITIEESHA